MAKERSKASIGVFWVFVKTLKLDP